MAHKLVIQIVQYVWIIPEFFLLICVIQGYNPYIKYKKYLQFPHFWLQEYVHECLEQIIWVMEYILKNLEVL